MSQTASLIATLKSCLKAQGKTYADVAAALGLSEASVKRLFADRNFSLERLDMLCNFLGMEISDLVRQMEAAQQQIEQLTHQQEHEIMQDLLLVMVTVCVFNRWSPAEITGFFTISESECFSRLMKLDKLNIIQLLPENRVKLLISPTFKWIENGPFERFFREQLGQEYFNTHFQQEREYLRVLNGMFSRPTCLEFQRKLERLVQEFTEMNRADAELPFHERDGVTLVMAMRDWDFGLFRPMIRPEFRQQD